ncbi:MAG: thiamine phosphate synthase [Hyphomonadaceae bacterium]|nr:thiamine phosphate synthase [Hyphomonadaceae bacterium]
MSSTYKEFDTLARVAEALYEARVSACRLAPYVVMTDPDRMPDIVHVAENMPEHSALIYRHFGAPEREFIARKLRQICFDKNVQLLIGSDEDLANNCGADGIHLPERDLDTAHVLRIRYPDWIISGATHSELAIAKATKLGVDAGFVSPVFESDSPSAGKALGIDRFAAMAAQAKIPIFALGGINPLNANSLEGSGAAGIAGVSGFIHD